MYEAFYGFREKPFSMLPDPGFLFLSKKHQAALTLLEYGLLNHIGFCVISGEAGAGKTTILRALLERVGDDVTVGLITNTHQSFGGLLDWVLSAFDLHQPNLSHVEMHQIFMEFLIEEYGKNRTVLLIVDEAQNMKADALEELRMLSNVNSNKDQLMQVVLAGQPALKETLRQPELMQFAQRIAVDYHLDPLGLKETCGYIQHRLKKAGATHDVFTPAACARIYNYSGGTPRLINLLCETVLVYGFADQKKIIDVELIDEMVQERMKDSVVPICNREAGPQDEASLAELEKDFPSIEGASAAEETPAVADIPELTAEDEDELPPLDASMMQAEGPDTLKGSQGSHQGGKKQTQKQAQEQTNKSTDGQTPDEPSDDSIADRGTGRSSKREASTVASTFKQAEQAISSGQAGNGAGNGAGNRNGSKKTGLIMKLVLAAVIIAALLIGVAVWLDADNKPAGDKASAIVPENTETAVKTGLAVQSEESRERLKKLEEEAAALKRERDAALKKIEEERRAKAEAEKRAAEKAAQARKAAEEKRRLEAAERKRVAAIREKQRRAREAAERAQWEAEQAKREAARLAEEKRLMEQRLEEERRMQAEQEALRLEQERLEQQRQAAAEARDRELAKLKAQELEKQKKKIPADCTGPTARFKSSCR